MAKSTRVTITLDMEYDNDLLNNGTKMVKKIREFIANNNFSYLTQSGDNLDTGDRPVNKVPSGLSSEFAHPAYTRYPHLKDQVLKQKAMSELNWDGDITAQDLADTMSEIIERKG